MLEAVLQVLRRLAPDFVDGEEVIIERFEESREGIRNLRIERFEDEGRACRLEDGAHAAEDVTLRTLDVDLDQPAGSVGDGGVVREWAGRNIHAFAIGPAGAEKGRARRDEAALPEPGK